MNKDQQLNKLFESARNEAPNTSFDETKIQFIKQSNLLASKQTWFQRLINLKNGFIMMTLASLITIGILIFSSDDKKEVIGKNPIENTTTVLNEIEEESGQKSSNKTKSNPIYIGGKEEKHDVRPSMDSILSNKLKELEFNSNLKEDETYVFPNLTEEDKKQVYDQKDYIVKMIVKRKSISSGGIISPNKYLSNTEVSNIEYRTFLFDLLIHGRKEDFLKVKPDQKGWGTYNDRGTIKPNPYVDSYFSHSAFDNYPVVNAPLIGMKMYCEWLNKAVLEKEKLKPELFVRKSINIELPTYNEWKDFAQVKDEDSLSFSKSEANRFANHDTGEPITSMSSDHADVTASVNDFKNSQGVTSLFGNAAEVVVNGDQYYAVGGCWEDTYEDLKLKNKVQIDAEFTGSKGIGFRPKVEYVSNYFFSNRDDLPTFSEEELNEIEKRKDDLVSDMIKRIGFAEYKVSIHNIAYLSKTELSNKDYKTFLYDLIASGRTEEYKKCKPNQEMWRVLNGKELEFMEPMVAHYFSHPAYDQYPVVNIPFEGIKAYMAWLNTLLDANEKNRGNLQAVVPSTDIYFKALKDGGDSMIPWGNDELAEYYINYKSPIKYLSSSNELNQEQKEKAKQVGVKTPVNAMFTSLVTTGKENGKGVYNLLGNVSEIIVESGKYKIVGGSWQDDLETIKKMEEIEIDSKFQGNSYVGFRIALTSSQSF